MASINADSGKHFAYAGGLSRRVLPIARNDHAAAIVCLTLSLIYATVRYNIFRNVPWGDWPTYVVNKGLGLSSLILLALTARRWSSERWASKTLMLWSGIFAGTHGVLSLLLLRPEYYPKFFEGSKYTGIAAFSMLFGALALAVQELGARNAKNWPLVTKQQVLGLLAALIGVHAALPGIAGWFVPSTWPGGLPPITLISATIAALTIYWAVLNARTRGFAQTPPQSSFRIVGH